MPGALRLAHVSRRRRLVLGQRRPLFVRSLSGEACEHVGFPGQRPVVLSHLARRYGREDREHDQRIVPSHAAPERAALGPQLLGAGRSRGSTRARP